MARANFGKALVRYERVVPWRQVRKLYYENEAEKYYKLAMERDDGNLDWPYELAELLIHKGADFDLQAAAELLEKIRLRNAGFRETEYQLAGVYKRLKQTEKAEELYGAIMNEQPDARIFLNKAFASAKEDSLARAEEYYLAAVNAMRKHDEPLLLSITGMLFSDTEMDEWNSSDSRTAFLKEFWLMRDPTPRTAGNERIREHFRRIAYARKNFVSPGSQNSYDDRGKIYIKYGEPSYRYQSSGNLHTFRNESWTYDYEFGGSKDGLVFDFANISGYGFVLVQDLREAFMGNASTGQLLAMYRDRADVNYSYYGRIAHTSWDVHDFSTNLQSLAEKKIMAYERAPSEFYINKKYPRNRIPMNISQAGFRGEDGKTHYEIYYALPLDALNYRVVNDIRAGSLNQELIVRRQADEELINDRNRLDFEFSKKEPLKGRWHVNQINLELPVLESAPVAHLQLEDPLNDQMSLVFCKLSNRDFSGDSLMISDMKFSYNIRPSRDENVFTRKGLHIIPAASRTFKKEIPVQVYFEVYNLQPGQNGQTSYKIQYIVRRAAVENIEGFEFFNADGELILPPVNKAGNEFLSLESGAAAPAGKEANYLSVDLSQLDEGEYEFLVNVVDMNTNSNAYTVKKIMLVE